MRHLISAVALSLFLAIGVDSPALAGEIRIEVRPGLTVRAGDGRLSRHAREQLRRAEERGWLKELLTDYAADRASYHPLCDADAEVELWAEDSEVTSLWFYRQPLGPLAAYVVVRPGRSFDPDDERTSYPAPVFMRIDGRPVEPGHWGHVWLPIPPPVRTLLMPGWTLARDERAEVQSGFVANLRQGRRADVEAALNNGETFSASFNLAGLDEALNLMERKMAESDAVSKDEIEELKKQLAAMD